MNEDVNVHTGRPDASDITVGIVAARFNERIVEQLVEGAVDALMRHGANPSDLHVVWAPGSFELPLLLWRLAEDGGYDALVALGAIIRGETPHFDYVASSVVDGASAVSRAHDTSVSLGVLTCDTWEQAVARAGGKHGNKGAEAALAAVETVHLLDEL